MNTDDVLFLMEYHCTANDRILETAERLTTDEIGRSGSLDHGSAIQTLRHMVDVDYSWRELCIGNDVGETYVWDVVPLPDLLSILTFWAAERARLLAYVGSVGDAGLRETVQIGGDDPLVVPIWQILAHVVNHGTQHRSELARYFTDIGHSPGDLDLI